MLQLGGSDPGHLAQSVRIAADWGYDDCHLGQGKKGKGNGRGH